MLDVSTLYPIGHSQETLGEIRWAAKLTVSLNYKQKKY